MNNALVNQLTKPGSCKPQLSSLALKAVVASLAVTCSILISGCGEANPLSDAYSRGKIDLLSFTDDRGSNPDWPYLDADDLTADVCGTQTDCVQAVGNEYLTLLKFKNVADAADYTATLGEDGVQIDPLVIDFNGTPLPAETREEIIYTMSNINASSQD